jgi:hypothetical protein
MPLSLRAARHAAAVLGLTATTLLSATAASAAPPGRPARRGAR